MLGCCVLLSPCWADVEPTCLGTAFMVCHVCHAVVQVGLFLCLGGVLVVSWWCLGGVRRSVQGVSCWWVSWRWHGMLRALIIVRVDICQWCVASDAQTKYTISNDPARFCRMISPALYRGFSCAFSLRLFPSSAFSGGSRQAKVQVAVYIYICMYVCMYA